MDGDKKEEFICSLKQALNIILNSAADQNVRKDAQKFVENFKESGENSSIIGMKLAHKDNDQISRHFGFQLLENCIKLKWNEMEMVEKQFIKDNSLSLIRSGTLDLLLEQTHIKDALSRVVVEIAKREWPQQWVNMVQEFNDLSSCGPIQEELILMILMRLAEDTLIFHTLPPLRRRDISQAFTAITSQLLAFFTNILDKYFKLFLEVKDTKNSGPAATATINTCIKLINRALECTTAFNDILPIHSLTPSFISLIITILPHHPLQLTAADCLLEIVAKKVKTDEKLLLLKILLSQDCLYKIQSLAVLSSGNLKKEEGFIFFKKLSQVIVLLGTQLCSLLTSHPLDAFSDTFEAYINILLSFTTHPSQVVSSYCMPLWCSIYKCQRILQSPLLNHFTHSLIHASLQILPKVGHPSCNDHPSCAFSTFDFDSDLHFIHFFNRYRAEFGEVLKLCTSHAPSHAYLFTHQTLSQLLIQTSSETAIQVSLQTLDSAHQTSLHLQWDVVVMLFDCTIARIDFMNINEEIVQSALNIYKEVLAFQTTDAVICSYHLSIISALFPILLKDNTLLSLVMDKLFWYINYSCDVETTKGRSKGTIDVRRHACATFIKVAKMYPDLLLSGFDFLEKKVEWMSNLSDGLSLMEKAVCYEALILIHNSVKNPQQQCTFIQKLLQPVRDFWLCENTTKSLSSCEAFMKLIGLTSAPVEALADDHSGNNRFQIQFCLNIIWAVLKRSLYVSEDGAVTCPASQVLLPLLANVFAIIKSYHEMFSQHFFNNIHPLFTPAFTLSDAEKTVLIGVPMRSGEDKRGGMGGDGEVVGREKTAVDRMTAFSNNLTEMGYSIIGQASKFMSASFYQLPNLSNLILNNIFYNIFSLPPLKIKLNLHFIYKQLISNCPVKHYHTILLPIIKAITPFFHQFLMTKWQEHTKRYNERIAEGGDVDDGERHEQQETQELIEDQLLIAVTKEYFECIDIILKDKKCQSSITTNVDAMDEAMEELQAPSLATPTIPPNSNKKKEESLGDLGKMVMAEDDLSPSITCILYTCLSWHDTTICIKAIDWCYPVLKYLLIENKMSATMATDLYHTLLASLNTHGQHDAMLYHIVNSLLLSYELLIPMFEGIRSLLLSVPGCTEVNLNAFNQKLVSTQNQHKNFEKKKREAFKILIEGAIGQNIGQRHKQNVHIKSLEPFKVFRHKQESLLSQNNEHDFGLCSLFSPD